MIKVVVLWRFGHYYDIGECTTVYTATSQRVSPHRVFSIKEFPHAVFLLPKEFPHAVFLLLKELPHAVFLPHKELPYAVFLLPKEVPHSVYLQPKAAISATLIDLEGNLR